MAKTLSVYLNDAEEEIVKELCRTLNCSESGVAKIALKHLANDRAQPSNIPGTFNIVETKIGRQMREERERKWAEAQRIEKARKEYDLIFGEGAFDKDRGRLRI